MLFKGSLCVWWWDLELEDRLQIRCFLFSEFKLVFPTLVDSNDVVLSNRVEDLQSLGAFVFPSFHAFGQNFTLYLSQNRNLLASNFIVEKAATSSVSIDGLFTNSNEPVKGSRSCHYVGTVKGQVNSSVAVDVCNGLVWVFWFCILFLCWFALTHLNLCNSYTHVA